MSFSPDRKLVVVRRGNNHLQVMDWMKNQTIANLQTTSDANGICESCVFLPDNRTLLAVVYAGFPKIQVWDIETRKMVKNVNYRGASRNRPVVSPDARFIATFGGGGVFLIETKTFSFVAKINVRNNIDVDTLCFSPDSKMLLGGDRLGNLRSFDIPELMRPRD